MPRSAALETRVHRLYRSCNGASDEPATGPAGRWGRFGGKAEHGNVLNMSTGNGSEPTVIVDDLHVVYRVFGAGGDKGTAATALMRVVKRQRRPSVREVWAIRGVSFVVHHGDAIGVIGRNGSGKSTLLQAIAGLLPPEQGCVYTGGQAALLGVNAALLDDLTGERNVVLGGLAMGMTPQEVKDRYESIVDFSGVGNFIDYPMRTYSTGMAQRLRFSIAAAKTHDILLIDEALATGDANFRTKSHEKIMELRGQAGTVFLVAHNLGEIEASCNRVIWLEKGKIVMQGYDVPAIVDAYLEATGGEPRRRDLPQEVDHTAD
jgi:teichoic acid transport system ATP-binding protein